jgi:hypothetical protein
MLMGRLPSGNYSILDTARKVEDNQARAVLAKILSCTMVIDIMAKRSLYYREWRKRQKTKSKEEKD